VGIGLTNSAALPTASLSGRSATTWRPTLAACRACPSTNGRARVFPASAVATPATPANAGHAAPLTADPAAHPATASRRSAAISPRSGPEDHLGVTLRGADYKAAIEPESRCPPNG